MRLAPGTYVVQAPAQAGAAVLRAPAARRVVVHAGRYAVINITYVTSGVTSSVGTGPSLATCSPDPCTAPAAAGLGVNVSVPDGAGKNYERAFQYWAPGNLHGVTPVVITFGDGAPSASDGSEAYYNVAAVDRFLVLRVACTGEDGTCAYNTPDISPYVLSAFRHCGASGTGLCDDAAMVKFIIQSWLPANIVTICPGCTAIDTSRIFVEGGSKGGGMTMDAICSRLSAPLIAGSAVTSAGPQSATASTNASVAPQCPALLTASGSFAPVSSPHRVMLLWQYGTLDGGGTFATSAVNAAGRYGFSADDTIKFVTGPPLGCSTTPTSQTLAGTGIVARIFGGCLGTVRQAAVAIPTACHAGSCDGSSGYQFGPEDWEFWTKGTFF